VGKDEKNKCTGSKQGTILSFFKLLPATPTKPASSSGGKAKNSPGVVQKKRMRGGEMQRMKTLMKGFLRNSKLQVNVSSCHRGRMNFPG